MKTTLTALTMALWMLAAIPASISHASTTPMYRTCQPFYYVEDANTFMNTLTQQQRDMAQLVLLPAFECPSNATCNSFVWIVEYEAPAAEAAMRGCGKVPGNSGSTPPSGVFGH